jgi:hypothetical protein
MTLYGWTLEQWACAAGWFEVMRKFLPLPSLRAAQEIGHAWSDSRSDAPGSIILTARRGGGRDETLSMSNRDYALRMMTAAANQVFPGAP